MTSTGSVDPVAGAVAVMRRELRAILADKQTLYLTVVLGLVLPLFVARQAARAPDFLIAMLMQVALLPFIGTFQNAVAGFAGEREHGTLAPLLATPLSNTSIFAGKLIGAYVPGCVTAAVGVTIVLVSIPQKYRANLQTVPVRALLQPLALALVTGLLLTVAGTLLGSRVKTVRSGQMIAGIVMAPVIIGTLTLSTFLFEHEGLGWLALAGMALTSVPLTWAGARAWRREEILTRI